MSKPRIILIHGWDGSPKRDWLPWLAQKINFVKVKSHTRKFVAIFSDNDPFVPLSNRARFHSKLGAKIITEHAKGHFFGDDHITKIPSVLRAILSMQK